MRTAQVMRKPSRNASSTVAGSNNFYVFSPPPFFSAVGFQTRGRSARLARHPVVARRFVKTIPPIFFDALWTLASPKHVASTFVSAQPNSTEAPPERRCQETVSPIFRNYDVVASIYPTLERLAFGQQLDDARNAFFDSLVCRNRLLLIEEGNGRFLGPCLLHKIGGSTSVLDCRAEML